MLKYFGLIISIVILLINLFYFDFDDSFLSEDNKVALIGIIGSLCTKPNNKSQNILLKCNTPARLTFVSAFLVNKTTPAPNKIEKIDINRVSANM